MCHLCQSSPDAVKINAMYECISDYVKDKSLCVRVKAKEMFEATNVNNN